MTKNFHFLLLSLLVLSLSSCEKEIVYEFETHTLTTEDFELCAFEQCPELSLNYVTFNEPKPLAQTINSEVTSLLKDLLTFEGQEANTIEQAAEFYLTNAQNAYPEDSILSETHVLHLDIDISYQSNDILSLRNDFYAFAGGAHGTGGVGYSNYNPKTGEVVTNESLFDDVEAFTAFAKAKFITTHGPLNQFWFENEVYALPTNMGFNENGLVLYYGLYEIATYADGDFELSFPWEEIQDYLAF